MPSNDTPSKSQKDIYSCLSLNSPVKVPFVPIPAASTVVGFKRNNLSKAQSTASIRHGDTYKTTTGVSKCSIVGFRGMTAGGNPFEATDSAIRISNWNAFQAPPHSELVYSAYNIFESQSIRLSENATSGNTPIALCGKRDITLPNERKSRFLRSKKSPTQAGLLLTINSDTVQLGETKDCENKLLFSLQNYKSSPQLRNPDNNHSMSSRFQNTISLPQNATNEKISSFAKGDGEFYAAEALEDPKVSEFSTRAQNFDTMLDIRALSLESTCYCSTKRNELWVIDFIINQRLDQLPCNLSTKVALKKIALDCIENKLCRQSLDGKCFSAEKCCFVHFNSILKTYEAKKRCLLDIVKNKFTFRSQSIPSDDSQVLNHEFNSVQNFSAMNFAMATPVNENQQNIFWTSTMMKRKVNLDNEEYSMESDFSRESEELPYACSESSRVLTDREFSVPSTKDAFLGHIEPSSEFSEMNLDPRNINSFTQLVGNFIHLARDQQGCRYLQRMLDESTSHEVAGGKSTQTSLLSNLILAETLPVFSELMMDPFGNYLCQKVMEFSSEDQRLAIATRIRPDVSLIAIDLHGTRSIQKLIQLSACCPALLVQLREMLCPIIVDLIKNVNGNHVIRKCLSSWQTIDLHFIFNSLAVNCVEVASHRHGCCVIQRCLDRANIAQRHELASRIANCALQLIPDPFGNYVIQYVLTLADSRESIIPNIIAAIKGHVIALSSQKFSSNVIEKCLRVSESIDRSHILDEIFRSKSVLSKLLRDSYANYVVQTSIDYISAPQRNLLIECLVPLLPYIQNTPYGKRIMAKLDLTEKNT